MSLDVYLYVDKPIKRSPGSGIFVRVAGATREVTREEWDDTFPGRDPVVVTQPDQDDETNEVFSANITHNLARMADAAGVYQCCWRPEELGITNASQLIEPLRNGLATLNAEPERFQQFNPSNGWGDYQGLCEFIRDYLKACIMNPTANIRISR